MSANSPEHPKPPSQELDNTVFDDWKFRLSLDTGEDNEHVFIALAEQLTLDRRTPPVTLPIVTTEQAAPTRLNLNFMLIPNTTKYEAFQISLHAAERFLGSVGVARAVSLEAKMLSDTDQAAARQVFRESNLRPGWPPTWQDVTTQTVAWWHSHEA